MPETIEINGMVHAPGPSSGPVGNGDYLQENGSDYYVQETGTSRYQQEGP